eukprot:s954_g19.t1
MWQTRPFKALFKVLSCRTTMFHHCRYGSGRRKLTRLTHSLDTFLELECFCKNDHEHEPWGQRADGSWATSEETAYPWPLARSMATQVALQLQSDGAQCHVPTFATQQASLQSMRAASNMQPRKGLPPLVPEFKTICSHPVSDPLPPLARKLSTPTQGQIASASQDPKGLCGKGHVKVGIHFSPEEFMQEATRLQHPTEQQSIFPKEMRNVAEYLTRESIYHVARTRTEEVRRWTLLASDMQAKEEELKSKLSTRISDVLRDKRLCVFEKLIMDSGHEDTSLVKDLSSGFDLTGTLPMSHAFEQRFKPASMSCEDLRKMADFGRDVFLESVWGLGT